jgi:hypothetical protein
MIAINSTDKYWTKHRYVLAFGAYGDTQLLVWANNLDDALDECIDWIVDNAPGLLCDDRVAEEYHRGIAEGMSEEDAHEAATADTTCGGNCGNYILSYEWSILVEDPTRAQLVHLAGV